jgi:hypothetical protein
MLLLLFRYGFVIFISTATVSTFEIQILFLLWLKYFIQVIIILLEIEEVVEEGKYDDDKT